MHRAQLHHNPSMSSGWPVTFYEMEGEKSQLLSPPCRLWSSVERIALDTMRHATSRPLFQSQR